MNEGRPTASTSWPDWFDPRVPHSSRVWNYLLGGKDNMEADRFVGDKILATTPQIGACALASRQFLRRAVRYLVAEGVSQFLDIGSGFPAAGNVHEIAHAINPEARVVYVDNDQIVLAHGRVRLVDLDNPETTAVVEGDAADPRSIVDHEVTRRVIDFDQPVAVILMNVLVHIPDLGKARSIVRTLVDAVPSGSYLAVSDATAAIDAAAMEEAAATWNKSASPPYVLRPPDEIELLFEGLQMLDPGLVSATFWRPTDCEVGRPTPLDQLAGVGRKP